MFLWPVDNPEIVETPSRWTTVQGLHLAEYDLFVAAGGRSVSLWSSWV